MILIWINDIRFIITNDSRLHPWLLIYENLMKSIQFPLPFPLILPRCRCNPCKELDAKVLWVPPRAGFRCKKNRIPQPKTKRKALLSLDFRISLFDGGQVRFTWIKYFDVHKCKTCQNKALFIQHIYMTPALSNIHVHRIISVAMINPEQRLFLDVFSAKVAQSIHNERLRSLPAAK